MRLLARVLIFWCFVCQPAEGSQFDQYVMNDVWVSNIIDGDSIIINTNRVEYKIRLWGIDTPEFDQKGAEQAKDALVELIYHKYITLFVKDRDKYGRLVALAEIGPISINEYLVKNGHAWVHVYYCHSIPCDDWYVMEKQARARGVGIWKFEDPIPPWQWKHNKNNQ